MNEAETQEQNSRRLFIKSLLLTSATLAAIGAPMATARDFPTRTIEIEDFTFDPATGKIRLKKTGQEEGYRLVIDGLTETPVELSYAALKALPSTAQVSDFHCVEGWTVPQVSWSGFRFSELLKLVGPLKEADHVLFHSLGKTRSAPEGQGWYVECLRIEDLLDPAKEMLMALMIDGAPLPFDRGAPLRVIAPYLQAYKSIKFVRRIEFVKGMREGWWTLANPIYDVEALVPRSRLRRR
jgi:DMSO/TMAO reductase YedYZ molybdopterin-dependent catalytic subunit